MSVFRARIGRVIMKAGGADISILPESARNETGRDMIETAAYYADFSEPGSELNGYVLIAIYSDGRRAAACSAPSDFPGELLPAYVAEVVRRQVVTHAEARDVVNWANGFVE